MSSNAQRCHLSLPIVDAQGNLAKTARVTFTDGNGIPLSDSFYNEQGVNVQNSSVWELGWVDVYLDKPQRVNLVIFADTFSTTMVGVDIPPPATLSATSPVGQPLVSVPHTSRTLLSDAGGNAVWGLPKTVNDHQHDGTQTGSTVLNADTSDIDTAPSQTWVGVGAGSALSGASDSALGSATLPQGSQSTTLGEGSSSVSSTASKGLAVGAEVIASAEQVALGFALDVPQSVYLPSAAYNQPHIYSTATDTSLFGLAASATSAAVGYGDIPATPHGVASPFWLQGDLAILGALTTTGNTYLGSPISKVGFFGSAGTAWPASIAGATGALASLLTVLTSYGFFSGPSGGYDGGSLSVSSTPSSIGYDGGSLGSVIVPSSAGYNGDSLNVLVAYDGGDINSRLTPLSAGYDGGDLSVGSTPSFAGYDGSNL